MKSALMGFLLLLSVQIAAQETPTIAEKTKGFEKKEGLLTFYQDTKNDKVWLELPRAGASGLIGSYLWIESLLGGLGSNDVGLDRGQLGPTKILELKRVGNRVLFEIPNLTYRALTDDEAERRAVRESFASSIIFAAKVAAEEDGRCLIDITPFLVRDAHRIREATRTFGNLTLDAERSVIDPAGCLAFPENLEFQTIQTYSSAEPSREVRSVSPDGNSVTLMHRHSLVKLPEPGYEPRVFDPRINSFPVTFLNYSAPLDKPIEVRWIARHRLEKGNPNAAKSPPKKPIVYYVDNAAPEPIRTALLEGARWWNQAFEAAGYENAFRVEILPENVHPLDVRYNVIQWVHRSTRGWSYGSSVTDPRTGEIIKGHVSLGSLRVRQDRMIFEGLLGVEKTGSGTEDDPIMLSLQRIRQLSAHELGHTLGFAHNFAASVNERASVMDYPAPWVRVRNGVLDVSSVYASGIGEWDKLAARYAYSDFPQVVDERAALNEIASEAARRGLRFLSDSDARAVGTAHPLAALWDNGADSIAALREALQVRRIALNRFGERNLAAGEPLALLEEVLVPIYYYHRYQVDAVGKLLGGMDYRFVLNGGVELPFREVPEEVQRHALQALLECLTPSQLQLPPEVARVLGPRPFGYGSNRELFPRRTGAALDSIAIAEAASDLVLEQILNGERAARMVELSRGGFGFEEVLVELTSHLFAQDARTENDLLQAPQWVAVQRMILLSQNGTPAVRALVDQQLRDLELALAEEDGAFSIWLATEILRYLDRPGEYTVRLPSVASPPPGSPIGSDVWGCCGG